MTTGSTQRAERGDALALLAGVLAGRNTLPAMPSVLQAKARPCPWLPALAHTTPRPARRRSATMRL